MASALASHRALGLVGRPPAHGLRGAPRGGPYGGGRLVVVAEGRGRRREDVLQLTACAELTACASRHHVLRLMPRRPASERHHGQRRSAPRPAPSRPARERPTASAGLPQDRGRSSLAGDAPPKDPIAFFLSTGTRLLFSIYRDLIAFKFLYTDPIVFHFYMQGSLCKF
jgi:hypothetical protein